MKLLPYCFCCSGVEILAPWCDRRASSSQRAGYVTSFRQESINVEASRLKAKEKAIWPQLHS